MGQYAVILAISAILLGGVLLYNARASTRSANDELSAYQTDRIAREASQIALRGVVHRLNDRPDAWTSVLATAQNRFNIDTTVYAMENSISVTYAARVIEMYLGDSTNAADPDRVRLKVKGAFDSWNEASQSVEPTEFVVDAVYERRWVNVHVPSGFRQAVWSNGDIDLSGTAWVAGDVHSNRNLNSSSGSFEVYGTGTYTGTESAQDNRFTGTPSLAERDSIVAPLVTSPPLSWDSEQPVLPGPSWALSTLNDPTTTLPLGDSLTHGWLTDAGGADVIGKGTATDPYVLFVNGNLSVSGPVRLPGHIRIYVNGTLSIGNDSGLSSTISGRPSLTGTAGDTGTWVDANLPDGVTIGLYVNGNVSIGERSFLAAMLYTNGTITHSGSGPRMIVGGIVSRQPVGIGGSAKVFYKEGADSVYDPRIPDRVPEGVRLVSYREWAERP